MGSESRGLPRKNIANKRSLQKFTKLYGSGTSLVISENALKEAIIRLQTPIQQRNTYKRGQDNANAPQTPTLRHTLKQNPNQSAD